ncbi:3',5'-cyclic-AMP phosphodiesterase [Gammaproteobacteria bacterium ESL0073]|nr:3',5'-cyclic-AMP phosphodiesterase [Gammaproteobacteria bacterium ESL0073]
MIAKSKNYSLCIQLTDCHLFADAKTTLLGIPTAESLNSVVAMIQKKHSDIDLVLATGDISQDGSLESYELFQERISQLAAPSLWVEGNHDDFSCVKNRPTFQQYLTKQQNLGEFWRIITLNSQSIGENCGRVSEDELNTLSQSLKDHPDRFHLICLHHPVFSCSNTWLNEIKLQDSWKLLERLEGHLNANVILCGHIHQEFEAHYRGIYLFATPSTCIQFAPSSEDFKIDTLAPGYRWIKLFNDGTIDTGISRLDESTYPVNLEVTRY